MASVVQLRGDTSANWVYYNPVLHFRELAIETDTTALKIGDGVTAWNSLDYWRTDSSVITITDTGDYYIATDLDGILQEVGATTVLNSDYRLVGHVPNSEKASANGVATLDSGGKIPAGQLPSTVMEFQGTYNASTNTPTLVDGTGNSGDVYITATAGTQDFGSGDLTFAIGDWVVYNGSVWEKSLNSDTVASVNGYTGVVDLDLDDIDDTATYAKSTVQQVADIDLNTTHRSSNGTNHANVVLNDTHRGTTSGNPHSVKATEISDFDTEVANNSNVTANTTHKNTNITSSVSAHGIQQGSGNGFDADLLDGSHKSEILANTTVYNIANSTNSVHNLPDATLTENQQIVKRRGDGTGLVTFTTESSQTIDTEVASNLELSGESSIILIPKSGNWESVKTGGASGTVVGVAGESISKGDLVYFYTDGKVYLGDNQELAKSILSGFAVNNASISEAVTIQSSGTLDEFSGLTTGVQYFLGNTANLITKGSIEYNEYIVPVGVAISTTELNVNISVPEPTRNQDDGNPVGSEKFFSTYKDRSAYGYRPFCFGEDALFSKANFPVLYAEIGDIYEAQHVVAGDPASDSNHFYGVPIPGAYERVGIPDIELIPDNIDDSTDLVTLTGYSGDRTLRRGTAFYFKENDGGILPAGITTTAIYYAILVSGENYRFYETEAEAVANSGTPLNMSSQGSGTFRLTQEGIVLDDAMQQITGEIGFSPAIAQAESGAFSRKTLGTNGPDGASNSRSSLTTFDSADSPDARTTNETRPKTNISFGYIKVEHVTTAGEPISALRYQWERGTSTSWQTQSLLITHNLNTDLKDLLIQVDVYIDSVGKWQRLGAIGFNASDSDLREYGVYIEENNNNSFYIKTGNTGILAWNGGVAIGLKDSYSGNIRATVIKPNLVSTIFDVSSLPKTYDLTSGDVTVTLSAITGVLQTKSVYWTNGDGTYKLRIKDAEGNYLDYEGEGEGHIELESDGSNWQVREYEDSGTTGIWEWKKYTDGRKSLIGITSYTEDMNTVFMGGYRGSTHSETIPDIVAAISCHASANDDAGIEGMAAFKITNTNNTSTGFFIFTVNNSQTSFTTNVKYYVEGTWK